MDGREFDIGSYDSLRFVTNEDTQAFNDELYDFFVDLEEEKTSDYERDLLEYELPDGTKIVFRYISYEYDEDSTGFRYLDWEGIVLK